jgi:hypothetical protein
MECAEAELLLAELIDEDSADATRTKLRLHMSVCGDCRVLFANLLLVHVLGHVAKNRWGKQQTVQVS